MVNFSNLKDLEKYLNKQINEALQNEVAETVKDVMQDKVQSEVYDVYTSRSEHPDRYVRRGTSGGIKDRENMKSNAVNNVLTVENTTKMKDTGYDLAGLIEYGHDNGYGEYDYYPAKNSDGNFRQPRPFLSETFKTLAQTNEHVESLKKGLRKKGLTVE